MKTGHCLTGLYLHWTKGRCWWCPHRTQTRGHLFKVCPEWKAQQKILWAEVWEEAGSGKSPFKVWDLLADGRCSQAVLGFLSTTDVGRLVPAEEGAASAGSGKRSGRRRPKELGGEGEEQPPFMAQERSREWVTAFLCSFLCLSLAISSVWHTSHLLGQAWAEGKGELATCHLRADYGRQTWAVCTSPST